MPKNKSIRLISTVILLFLAAIFATAFYLLHTSSYYATAEIIGTPATLEELRRSDITDIAALSSYDSRDYGIVTSVKDQGNSDLCWAYASIAAAETSILRSGISPDVTKDNLSLSPEALGYSRFNRPSDPLGNTAVVTDPNKNWYNSAGNAQYSTTLMSQWCNPTDKSLPANVNPFENALFHLNNAVQIDSTSISEIKLAIAKYGAITFSYNNLQEAEYFNPKLSTSSSSYPHACTLIGWDDNIPAEKFVPRGATQNGGWLVKNSYLSLPYFWLSYDNTSYSIFAFDFTAKQTYDYNYFYDYNLDDSLNYTIKAKKACEIFEAKKGSPEKTEFLKAVNVGFLGKNVTAKVDIYVDMTSESNPESGMRVGGGQANFKYSGFRTVNLDTPIALENGKKFACVVSVENPTDSVVICNMLGKRGTLSFIYKDYWSAANNCTPRIKAFTSLEENESPPPVKDINQVSCALSYQSTTYNGSFHYPSVSATFGGIALSENADYTLSYKDNKNAGTASITVKGIGEYTGQKIVYFTINKAEAPPTAVPATIEIEADTNLSTIRLPDGWRLLNPDVTVTEGESKQVALIYQDTENYLNYTTTVIISRKTTHRHSLVSYSEKPATCTEDGILAHDFCSLCNKNFINGIEKTTEELKINATGHTWSADTVHIEPTCTADGLLAYSCTSCEATDTQVLQKLGHNVIRHEAKAATCTAVGWDAYETCSRCDYSTYSEIAALGHYFANEYTVDKLPSCTEKGNKSKHCSRCDEITDKCEIPAKGHTWSADAIHIEPSCTADGLLIYNCISCEATDTHVLQKLGHGVINHPAKAATCTAIGWDAYETCSRCNYTTYSEIAVLGHDFANEYTVDKLPSCTEKGSKSKHCSRCNEITNITEIAMKAHALMHFMRKEATTSASGNIEYWSCQTCGKYFSDNKGISVIDKESVVIPVIPMQLVKPDSNDSTLDIVIVTSPNGFAHGIELIVTEIAEKNYTDYDDIAKIANGEIKFIYDVSLMNEGVIAQPDNTVTVKLRIPENLEDKNFKIFHLHENEAIELNYSLDNNYVTVNTDKLSEFIFVCEQTPVNNCTLSKVAIAEIVVGAISFILFIAFMTLYFVRKKR